MAEVIDLAARLDRLNATVSQTHASAKAERASINAAQQSRKAADWAAVQERFPSHAEFITACAAAFGKPARVRVKTDDGEMLLDS